MKILYLTPQLPFPPISGGRIKLLSTVKALVSLGHEVTLFSLFEKKEDLKYLNDLKKIGIKKIHTFYNREIGQRSISKRAARFITSFLSTKPYSMLRYFNKQMKREIETFLQNNHLDVLWIGSTDMACYLPETFSGLKFLETLDCLSGMYKEAVLKTGNIKSALFYLYEWFKYYLYEKSVFQKFDKIFAVCERDRQLFTKITNGKKIDILPPVIENKKLMKIKKEDNTLLFAGTLFWHPNRDGTMWFLKKVYPKIQEKKPGIKLWIIGPYLPNFKPIELKGVEYLGPKSPQEVEYFMNRASVFICPITYGTAIRVKILKAMSCGIPVISTVDGAKGLDLSDGKELLIAYTADEFIQKTIRLLKDNKLRQRLIKNGRKFIKENYSEEKLRKAISRVNSLSTA